ncbi:MAG: hypothetical protein KOO60_07405 [Gemmatimonadales bacterium]|nr:hypothetical protein [Gemmatimonadales bacterium]
MSFYDEHLNPEHKKGVWATCPLLAIACNPGLAAVVGEDFTQFNDAVATTSLPGWTVTQAGSQGAVSIDDAAGGVLLIDSDSATVTQGANVQKIGECFLPAADKDIWFEARFKIVDTFDKCELFVGLSETDTAIIDTSANASASHIAWQCVTDDGVLLLSSEKAGTGETKAAATIEEDTWIKVGFHVSGLSTVDQYIDDVLISTTTALQHVTANIPIVEMTPSFVCQSGGTNDPIMHVDYVKVVQVLSR